MKRKRETAYKVRIKDILKGDYIVKEGWEPNYIKVGDKKFSRVNIMGTIVGNENGVRIDDGTGKILLRSFDEPVQSEVGKVVLVIGRPREYDNERFIMPEIIKEIEDADWIKVRNKEVKEIKHEKEESIKKTKENVNPKIINYIKKQDNGEGISTQKIIEKLKIKDEDIKKLLEEGEIFEIKPGIVKILS